MVIGVSEKMSQHTKRICHKARNEILKLLMLAPCDFV